MGVYILLLFFVILSVFDCREKQVPVLLLGAGAVAASVLLICKVISGQQVWHQILGVLPGVFLLVVAFVTKKAGYADGVVIAIAGVVLGYKEVAFLFCISLLLISLASVVLLLFRKVNGQTQIPYLPFLTTAFVFQMICIK